MTIQVNTQDQRTAKALELLSGADRWLKITSKVDGRRYYVVPSSDGQHVYWVRPDACTCPDATRRGLTCKHQIAAALFVAKVNAGRKPGRAASVRETLAERETREARVWGVRPTPLAFTRDASIGGTIQAPEAARRRCLADDVWGTDGEGN